MIDNKRYSNDGSYLVLPAGSKLPAGLELHPIGEGVTRGTLRDGRLFFKDVFWPEAELSTIKSATPDRVQTAAILRTTRDVAIPAAGEVER